MTTTDVAKRRGPRAIFVIRHGEKPPDASDATAFSDGSASGGPPCGVDINGKSDPDSLIPQGWQRAGALASLFDPTGQLTASGELAVPTMIATPRYGKPQKHRTFETVLPTALKLKLTPSTEFSVGCETHLVDWVLAQHGEVVLICWEHDHIINITDALQPNIVSGPVPGPWPSARFDIVVALWSTPDDGSYVCFQVPQLLLAGDSDQPIPPATP